MKEKAIEQLEEVYKVLAECKTKEAAQIIAAQYGLVNFTNEDWQTKNLSVKKFFETDPKIAGRRTDIVYKEYLDFCTENKIFPVKRQRGFTRSVNNLLGFRVEGIQKNGKRYSIFVDVRNPKPTTYNKELSDQIYNFAQSGYFEEITGKKYFDDYVTSFVYDIYTVWCEKNSLEPTNLISFVRVLCDISAYKVKSKSIEGVVMRVFYLNS